MIRFTNRSLLVLPFALSFALAAGFLLPSFAATPAGAPRVEESQPVNIEVLTTGYTAHDPGENGKGITYTGTRARPGECAVDPGVIPLGSLLWVPGYSAKYGLVRAEDTGGLIKGDRIDLFFLHRREALDWGERQETVTVWSGDEQKVR